MIRILGTIFAGLLGLAFGSFLSVCLSRWPEGESIVSPRSHCRNCDHTLAWWENVPLVSWFALRGRCQKCGSWLGWRYPVVELAVGILWAVCWLRFAAPAFADGSIEALNYGAVEAIGFALFFFILIGLSVLDAEYLWLPDAATLSSVIVGVVFSVLRDRIEFPASDRPHTVLNILIGRAISIVAAAIPILFIRWIYRLIRHREGIGLGDAKLMALLAAWLGFPLALLAFFLGVVLGAVVALVQLAIPSARKSPGEWALAKLPLGTFLCIGGIVSALWGQPIIAMYLRWAGF
jgi:leader peptidase (prepilin peptidase) / N-methyltransferase